MNLKHVKTEEPWSHEIIYTQWSGDNIDAVGFKTNNDNHYGHRAYAVYVRRDHLAVPNWPVLCLPNETIAKIVLLHLVNKINKIENMDEGAVDQVAVAIDRVRHELNLEVVACDVKPIGGGGNLRSRKDLTIS